MRDSRDALDFWDQLIFISLFSGGPWHLHRDSGSKKVIRCRKAGVGQSVFIFWLQAETRRADACCCNDRRCQQPNPGLFGHVPHLQQERVQYSHAAFSEP